MTILLEFVYGFTAETWFCWHIFIDRFKTVCKRFFINTEKVFFFVSGATNSTAHRSLIIACPYCAIRSQKYTCATVSRSHILSCTQRNIYQRQKDRHCYYFFKCKLPIWHRRFRIHAYKYCLEVFSDYIWVYFCICLSLKWLGKVL